KTASTGNTSVVYSNTEHPNIDETTKAYIDNACKTLSSAIISTIKTYIDQSIAIQIELINKLNERLDFFNQQQKPDPKAAQHSKT
ncbi:5905_t:CDS:1, partial [Racocetra persica]